MDEDDIPTGEVRVDADDLEAAQEATPRQIAYDWKLRLAEMIDELREREDIELVSFELHEPVGLVVQEMIEHGLGFYIPTPIKTFYEFLDGMQLRWNHLEEGVSRPGGEANLFAFSEVFGNWMGHIWGVTPPEKEDDDRAVDFTWELRAIDGVHLDGDELYVALHVPEVLPAFNLFLHEPRGSTYRMSVDFLRYLDCLLETRATYGWQYLLTRANYEEDEHARERAEAAHTRIKQLFPDADLSRFHTPDDEHEDE